MPCHGGRYLRCAPEDIAAHVAKVKNPTLREMMMSGVIFLHAGLDPRDRKIADSLYVSGAMQVAVVARDLCWGLQLQSRLVVLMDTQSFDGKEHR
jgi:pre-mRNA-splicing helicase BRR2